MKILVADDNPFYLCALGALLKEWGYEVISARTGEAAWNALREENAATPRYDLMISELAGPWYENRRPQRKFGRGLRSPDGKGRSSRRIVQPQLSTSAMPA